MWFWIAVGLGSVAAFSLLMGLAFARILRALGEASKMHEADAPVVELEALRFGGATPEAKQPSAAVLRAVR
jgi:hypothetical protein